MIARNFNLDLMRLLGLLMIMVAHASPPDLLFQIRNFDVPLLVIVSALCYAYNYTNRDINILSFYKKRLSKLIIPAWIFLCIFFGFIFAATQAINIAFPFTYQKTLSSFVFTAGIGYVWIFKIFIILALITPAIIYINRKIHDHSLYFLYLLMAYIGYEYCVFITPQDITPFWQIILDQIVFLFMAYSIIYAYGFRLLNLANKQIYLISFISLVLFSIEGYMKYIQIGSFVPTQNFKYPPTLYYISYAIFATNIFYIVCKSLNISNNHLKSIITWLSAHSLWIYLWHIMAAYMWRFAFGIPESTMTLFIIKALFLLGFGASCTLIQNFIIHKIFPENNAFAQKISGIFA